MVTETEKSLKILAETEMRPILGISDDGSSNGEDLGKEEGEMNLYRSGSAPPTVEGSLTAVGGLFSHGGDSSASASVSEAEEELRSDPSYLSYYYSNVNLNPRLPPPLLSKEDWRFARRSSVLGGIGDRRNVNQVDEMGSRSLFSLQPGFNSHLEESEIDSRKQQVLAEWGTDGLIGLPDLGLGSRRNSFADIFQDDLGRATLVSGHPSRPVSCISFNSGVDTLGPAEAKLTQLQHELTSADSLRSANVQGISMVPNIGASTSHTFASTLGSSLSRSTTPDPQLIVRVPSPYLPPVGGGRFGASDKRSINGPNSFSGIPSTMSESVDLITAFSGINLSTNNVVDNENHLPLQIQQEIDDHQNFPFNMQGDLEQVELHNSYLKGPSPPNLSSVGGLPPTYHNVDGTNSEFANYGLSGHSINPALLSMMANQVGSSNIPPLFENVAAASAMAASGMDLRAFGGGSPSGPNLSAAELHNLNRMGNHMAGSALQVPPVEPMYLQYLRTEYAAAQLAALNDPSIDRNYMGNSYVDLLGLQKAYLESLLSAQKSQYGDPFIGKSGGLNNSYYGNPTFGGLGMYPGSPLASPVVPNSPVGSCSPLRRSERDMQFTSGMRNLAGGVMGSWHLDSGANLDESFASSLLEEFKSNKTRSFELSVIEGHVVEFSADQYGSRFIQQKLETATAEEKNMVYQEIMPQAFSLMTDVFGNYVIQKFFEHGTTFQRRELANQLNGHVLTLSLQMYGCRVIQKAIEVVDLDQQTNMVAELDGHVMRCVRDQNGNHVIQKCIECVPQDAIQFIITSFYDQVVALSTHPYGCRVIQRVLEHCNDPTTQRIMMDEILQYICMLAQDQYGNYVVQHVLEHGKPHERSAIIKKLAGQIVQMSQQKFASNVVEKCLTFGGPEERQILVNEMLGTTDENEPLQAMMKDQFANYVVQKVLETCDDQQRELILSRIKVHLSALKKYTYGKHIVARVEKLVAAGERRIGPRYTYPDLIA